jgi:hypothetical protein
MAVAETTRRQVMRLMMIFELATRTDCELRVLFRLAADTLDSPTATPARKANARLVLDAVVCAMRCKRAPKP